MTKPDTVVSCPAPYCQGGLGRHFAQIVEQERAAGRLAEYYTASAKVGDRSGRPVLVRWFEAIARYTPARFSGSIRAWWGNAAFDRAVAGRLTPGRVLVAFAGSALQTFRRARRLGFAELHLESASAHVGVTRRMYDAAFSRQPIETDWLHPQLIARTLAEYEAADVIWVNSDYARQTFVDAGVPSAKVRRRWLSVDPRFHSSVRGRGSPAFHVLYVGSLTVAKGVPLLLDAFARADLGPAELSLVGHTGSRGMRRFVERRQAADGRIRVCPGDPLPHLERADVYVHPSYQDGFGYAVAEALAAGVPVIVTEDTGAKELVRPGVNGWVVPTGDLDALVVALEHARRHPLRPAAAQPAALGL